MLTHSPQFPFAGARLHVGPEHLDEGQIAVDEVGRRIGVAQAIEHSDPDRVVHARAVQPEPLVGGTGAGRCGGGDESK